MTCTSRSPMRRLAATLAALMVLMTAAPTALAAPLSGSVQRRTTPTGIQLGTARVGAARVSVTATASAIPVGGGFSYDATVRSSKPLDFLQVRMKLFMPTGRLVYQKTFVEQTRDPGTSTFTFTRSIADIDLESEAYPIEISVRSVSDGVTSDDVITSSLLVYDPAEAKTPIALVARVSAQPLTEPDGRLVSDPSQSTRARDDVVRIAEWVLSDVRAHVTLSLSPMMLEEWRRISDGYLLANVEGDTQVEAQEETPRSYAAALEVLKRAAATGRLEVLSTGYSDPSLSELQNAKLLDDVSEQYRRGASAVFSAMETTASAGTAPAGSVPEAAVSLLVGEGIDYAVVRDSHARAGGKHALFGRHVSRKGGLKLLVSDDAVARTVSASPTAHVAPAAYARRLAAKPGTPLPLLLRVGPAALDADKLIAVAQSLESQPWATLVVAAEAATGAGTKVELTSRSSDPDAPREYWPAVRDARAWARALQSALPTDSGEADQVARDSLVAEGVAWAGHRGEWSPASRGLAHAASARRSAEAVLGGLSLGAKAVTLAGSSGELPVTVVNKTEHVLRATLVTRPGSSVQVDGGTRRAVELRPGENFIEVPVHLNSVLTGELEVALFADELELADTTVSLRASYLDRLAMVGGVLVLLGGLLAFIIVRVRAAEAAEQDEENGW